MIVEQRTYTLQIGATAAYRDLYLAEGYPVQAKILGEPLGYYVTEVGPQNQIVHLWRYESFEDRETRRTALFQDQDWISYIKKAAPLVVAQENRILKPLL